MARSNNRDVRQKLGSNNPAVITYAKRRRPVATSFRDRVSTGAIAATEAPASAPSRLEDVQVVMPGDRTPRLGDYLFFRQPTTDRLEGYWYVHMRPARGIRGERWSTKCTFDQVEMAKKAYLDHLADLDGEREAKAHPERQFVADILAKFIEDAGHRHHDLNKISSDRLENIIANIRRLVPFVRDKRLGQIDRTFSGKFMEWATTAKPRGGGWAHNTAALSVWTMREALETVLSDAWNQYRAPFEVPDFTYTSIEVFSPEEIKRVKHVGTTREQWCAETKSWIPRRTEEFNGSFPNYRLFMLGLWFGNRLKVSLNAEWVNNGGPWIDLERGRMYRLGTAERETSKRKGYCRIPKNVLPVLKAWRDEDKKGDHTRVVRLWDNTPLKEVCYRTWYAMLKAAGVRPLSPHACKHTCAQMLRLKGVPLEQASMYLFTLMETLVRNYGADWDDDLTSEAAEAISSIEGGDADVDDDLSAIARASHQPGNGKKAKGEDDDDRAAA